jgi:hypothetical protein
VAGDAGRGRRNSGPDCGARLKKPNPDPDRFDEVEIIFCGGSARPEDTHLASTIHAVNDEIFEFLERRERRKRVRLAGFLTGKRAMGGAYSRDGEGMEIRGRVQARPQSVPSN